MTSTQSREERFRFFALLDFFDQCDSSEAESVADEDPGLSHKRPRLQSPFLPYAPATAVHKQKNNTTPVDLTDTSSTRVSETQLSPPKSPLSRRKTKSDKRQPLSTKAQPCIDLKPATNNKSSAAKKKDVPLQDQIFRGLVFFFIPNNDVAEPRKSRIRNAIAHGAKWSRKVDRSITHVVVDRNIDIESVAKIFPDGQIPSDIVVVKDDWLVESLNYNVLRDPSLGRFQLKGSQLTRKSGMEASGSVSSVSNKVRGKKNTPSPRKQDCLPDQDELETVLREVRNSEDLPLDPEVDVNVYLSIDGNSHFSSSPEPTNASTEFQSYQCMEKNDGGSLQTNPNRRTIEILQQMATHYDRIGDNWRTVAYRKAVNALRKQNTLIRTRSEALAIYGIGDRLADKIEEIVGTDRLRRLEYATDNPDDDVLQLFMGIYGVGYAQARTWIDQGYRSLADLKRYAKLTENQKVGMAHYQDFLKRIPRQEVEQHANIVQRALRSVDPKLQAIVGGSYRRGSADSGDVDIIITKENAKMEQIRALMKHSVIPKLEAAGFLKHAFAATHNSDDGSKWHGASTLSANAVWRRIDLLFVPWDELGASLIYFTGNDIFNRSIRLLASRKGMRLNQHGLYADVMRGKGRARITDGRLVEGRSEKKIFEILGVPWRPPEHRQC